MSRIIVTRGLPASGKSTWALEWVQENPKNRVRVNRDSIRKGLFGRIANVDEKLVTDVETATVKAAIAAGKDVVIDACHLAARYVKKWAALGTVEVVDFPIPVEEAELRDARRKGIPGEHSVGEDVIWGMAKRYRIRPEGTLPDIDLSGLKPFEFAPAPEYDPGKDDAIILDVDGTIAKMNGKRGPYETDKYHLDDVEPNLRAVIRGLSEEGYRIVVTSGRSEDFRNETFNWLKDNAVPFNHLVMRKSGDMRNDAIVKHDLFHEFIAPKYNVVMAYDDRNRVVDMWREIGIVCAQMDYGDF